MNPNKTPGPLLAPLAFYMRRELSDALFGAHVDISWQINGRDFPKHNAGNAIPIAEAHAVERPAGFAPHQADRLANQIAWRLRQTNSVQNSHFSNRRQLALLEQVFCLSLHITEDFAGLLSEPAKQGSDGGVILIRQERQQLTTNFVSHEARIGIRAVLAK